MKKVSRCPPLRYGAELSSLVMSGLAFCSRPPVTRYTTDEKFQQCTNNGLVLGRSIRS